jgi:tetratricopeptide (TPR) repeat protein
VLLAKTKRDAEAIKIFETVLQIKPDHPQATVNLGFLYNSIGKYEKAIAFLKAASIIQPKDYDILFNLGTALLNTKNYDEANKFMTAAAEISPDRPEPFYFRTGRQIFCKRLNYKTRLRRCQFYAGRDFSQTTTLHRSHWIL